MMASQLSANTRKALIAAGIVLTLSVASPAAAESIQFGFSINGGNGSFGLSLGNGGFIGRQFTPPAPRPVCLTDRKLRAQLRNQGFSRIEFGRSKNGWKYTKARWNGRSVSFDVNRCSGDIANFRARDGRRIAQPYGGFQPGMPFPGGFSGGGFGAFPVPRR